jgi:hypothetical protein
MLEGSRVVNSRVITANYYNNHAKQHNYNNNVWVIGQIALT